MNATKQLILRLPPELHRAFKMLSVAREKTMTDIVIDWIKRETSILKGQDPLVKRLTVEAFEQVIKEDDPLVREFSEEEMKKWAKYELERKK